MCVLYMCVCVCISFTWTEVSKLPVIVLLFKLFPSCCIIFGHDFLAVRGNNPVDPPSVMLGTEGYTPKLRWLHSLLNHLYYQA